MPHATERSLARILAHALLGSLLLCGTGLANAGLVNGDFSSGFTGWSGEVTSDGTGTLPADTPQVVDPATFASNYSASGGAAQIQTADASPDIYSVVLFQDFTIDPIAVGSTLSLSLSITTSLTSPIDDFAFAQLEDLSGTLGPIDLLAGGTFDVTAWAGSNATLSFGVSDADFLYPDIITVSTIVFAETVSPQGQVPAPGALWLVIAPLLAWRLRGTSAIVNT